MIQTYPEYLEAYGQVFSKDSNFIEGFKILKSICPAMYIEGYINLTRSIIVSDIELSELHMVLIKAKLNEINKLIKVK
jgi:hypothetical protein